MRDDDDLGHWDSDRVRDPAPRPWDDRSNHDLPDYDPDGELDRWFVRGIWVLMLFGIWKLLDLAWALASLLIDRT